MNRVMVVLIMLLIGLTACSTHELIIPEIELNDPRNITKLNNQQLSISTKDSVRFVFTNASTGKTFYKKRILANQLINNYKVSGDSIFINDPNFQSVLGLQSVSAFKFKGVFDNELGVLDEKEIMDFVKENYRQPKGLENVFYGAGIGFVVGGIGAQLGLSSSDKILWMAGGAGVGALLGLCLDLILNTGSDKKEMPRVLSSVIDDIKSKRQIKSEQ